MKHIILHLDRAFFNKINADKLVKQAKLGKKLTWEQYIRELFGFGTKHITSFRHTNFSV
jgi:hypothetical protein